MKNLHLIETDKLSRLYISINGGLYLHKEPVIDIDIRGKNQNIYITNSEEIKEGDWFIYKNEIIHRDKGNVDSMWEDAIKNGKKIILTTDQDLINNGVQAIDDEFLEWFVKNPSCEKIETKLVEFEVDMGLGDSCIEYGSYYKIIIPKEEPKQPTTFKELFANTGIEPTTDENGNIQYNFKATMKEEPKQETTLEEIAKKVYPDNIVHLSPTFFHNTADIRRHDFIQGYNLHKGELYSEEDMINFAFDTYCYISILMKVPFNKISENKLHAMYNFENFKKDLK